MNEQLKWLAIACKVCRQIIKPALEDFLASEDWRSVINNLILKLEFDSKQEPVPYIDGEVAIGSQAVCPLFVDTIMDLRNSSSLFFLPYNRLLLALKVMREKFIEGTKYYSELDPEIPPEEQQQIIYDCQPRYYDDALYFWGEVVFTEEYLKGKIAEAMSDLFDEGGVLDQIEARIAENNILLAN